MYKIQYDHFSRRLDVQFILDFSDANTPKADSFVNSMATLIAGISKITPDYPAALVDTEFNGSSRLWIKRQADRFDDDYCFDQLLMEYDRFYNGGRVFVCRNKIIFHQSSRFYLAPHHLAKMEDHFAIQFSVDVESMYCGTYLYPSNFQSVLVQGVFA